MLGIALILTALAIAVLAGAVFYFRETEPTMHSASQPPHPGTPDDGLGSFTKEELDSAVMDKVYGHLPRIALIDAKWGSTSEAAIDRAEAAAAAMEAWADTLENKRVRKAYMGWIEFHRRDYRKARTELRTHEDRDRADAYWKDREKHWDRARSIPIPKPPNQ